MITNMSPGPRSVSAQIVRNSRASYYSLSGVTRDNEGNAVGGVVVDVFEAASPRRWRGSTISDASGNYKIEVAGDRSVTLQVVMYLPGSPDTGGVSVNTLVAV